MSVENQPIPSADIFSESVMFSGSCEYVINFETGQTCANPGKFRHDLGQTLCHSHYTKMWG